MRFFFYSVLIKFENMHGTNTYTHNKQKKQKTDIFAATKKQENNRRTLYKKNVLFNLEENV